MKGPTMLRFALVAVMALTTGTAFADEVIIHRDDAPPPSSRTVTETHSGDTGCASKTVKKENDLGDSKTVTKSDC